jgi:hypothetical protein
VDEDYSSDFLTVLRTIAEQGGQAEEFKATMMDDDRLWQAAKAEERTTYVEAMTGW